MFEKRDREFQEALEVPSKLEQRLESLRSTRRIGTIMAAFMAGGFFICLFLSIGMGSKPPTVTPAVPLMLFLMIQQAWTASGAHSEIRSLLAFKKLRELSATP